MIISFLVGLLVGAWFGAVIKPYVQKALLWIIDKISEIRNKQG